MKKENMSKRIETLLHMYEEHAAQARQHEDQRERMTNLVLLISAALVGLIGHSQFALSSLPAAVLVAFLGFYGTLFSLKHYERNRMHTKIMAAFRRELDRELSCVSNGINALESRPSLSSIRERARNEHYNEFSWLGGLNWTGEKTEQSVYKSRIVRWKLYRFWAGLPFIIGSIGVTLSVVIILKN